MVGNTEFAKLVPGFEFLQGLMKQAGGAMPDMGQWIAPTLDPDELGKRIEQLKTVQFWLEQNTRMIQASIQALEVQRMTLSTLKSMDVPVQDLMGAFMLNPQADGSAAKARAATRAAAPDAAGAKTEAPRARRARGSAAARASEPAGAGVVDPVKWWGALTEQFTQLATQALKEAPLAPGAGASPADPPAPRKRPAPARKASRKAG